MSPKFKILTLVVAGVVLMGGCQKFDDTALWERIEDLDRRMSAIEKTLRGLNTDLNTISQLVKSLSDNIQVTGVTPTEGGFVIRFSDGTSYTVTSGKDGATPYIGSNGNWWVDGKDSGVPAAGKDGASPYIESNGNWWIGGRDTGVSAGGSSTEGIPVIGIKELDGVYYWTQTLDGVTAWLTDSAGNKIPVTGSDGVTPLLKVDNNGYWTVSYDKGVSFQYLLDAKGQRVKAVCDCTTFFRSVSYSDGVLTLVLIDGTVIAIKVDEGSEREDPRLDSVVPKDIQDDLDDWMPIYDGVTPPDVEGAYLVSTGVCVYCEDEKDGGYSPGDTVADMTLRFSNQDSGTNTLDYDEYQGKSSARGVGAFISGKGNNFTAYFNTEGTTRSREGDWNISFKTALVISGTKTSAGIKDLYYAFVMIEKSGDSAGELMEEGVYRIFTDKDGLSVPTTWSPPSLSYGASLLLFRR